MCLVTDECELSISERTLSDIIDVYPMKGVIKCESSVHTWAEGKFYILDSVEGVRGHFPQSYALLLLPFKRLGSYERNGLFINHELGWPKLFMLLIGILNHCIISIIPQNSTY